MRWAEIKYHLLIRFIILPLFLLGFLLFFRIGNLKLSPIQGIYILTGNLVLSLSAGPISLLMQEMSIKKANGLLEIFKLLPITASSYTMAIIITEFCAALPGAIMSFVLGMLLFQIQLEIKFTLLLLLPASFLCSYCIAGIGSLIGLRTKNPMQANLVGQIALYLFAFFVPVMIPEKSLPSLLLPVTWVSPVHQSARLIRMICTGDINIGLLFLALLIFLEGSVFLWIGSRSLRAS